MLSVLMVVSCSDLEENPAEVQLAPESLSSDSALEALVAGMYRKLQNNAQWSAFFIAGYGGDDISTRSTSNKAGFRDSDWRMQTPSSDRLNDAYNGCYNAITIANTAIAAKDNIEGDQAIIDRLIGEAYFMRAFSYFHLTRTYGRVPVQLVPNSNEALTRASFEDIYMQIESDFHQAEILLPDVYPDVPAVGTRPNKGSAKAFLARLYMHWAGYPLKDTGKYALATSKAKEVIDNEGVYGFGLTTDFRAMWTEAGRFAHNEGVFTLIGCTAGCGIGNRTTGRLGLTNAAGGWNETFGEIAFYENQMAAAAVNGTMQRFEDTYISEVIPRASNPVGADFMNEAELYNRHPMFRKIVGGDFAETVNTTRNDINRYFMRYADVLLMYAEASGRSGNVTADAWEALNRVRRRAGATLDLTSGDLAELAYTERKWEFAGEYERWHDLVRMERVIDAFANRSPLEDVDVTHNITPSTDTSGDYFYFSPIPQSELDNSPQLND
ncbi:MAG: RagB/SusD family nutrient uptake outer membrane protein [Bacteroidota bacterium]